MRILQIAPLWEDVPPKKYGGTELVVHILCEELVKRGHDVSIIASKGSKTSARLISPISVNLRQSKSVMPTFYENISAATAMQISGDFDVIHNHCGLSVLPFHRFFKTPMLTTLHGAFVVEEEIKAYKSFKNLSYISISNSQRVGNKCLNYVSTIYNGIRIERFDFQEKPDTENPYLCFLGRISPEKGVHLAIELAKKTGWKLIIAAKIDKADVDYYENTIKPEIDGVNILYIGEVEHKAKVELLKNAHALVHAVTWPEPFGLTMAESMACGTPVLALNLGSVPEVVRHGVTGYVEDNIDDLMKRVNDIGKIDRYACRKHVVNNFSGERMVHNYVKAYYKLVSKPSVSIVSALKDKTRTAL